VTLPYLLLACAAACIDVRAAYGLAALIDRIQPDDDGDLLDALWLDEPDAKPYDWAETG
jgi:hypothetical protein